MGELGTKEETKRKKKKKSQDQLVKGTYHSFAYLGRSNIDKGEKLGKNKKSKDNIREQIDTTK